MGCHQTHALANRNSTIDSQDEEGEREKYRCSAIPLSEQMSRTIDEKGMEPVSSPMDHPMVGISTH